jgi:hypothetical protein
MLAAAVGMMIPANAIGATPAPPAEITNISVGVSAGIASYYLCVVAPRPPAAGGVTVHGPHGDVQAPAQPTTQSCGSGSYLVQATFPHVPNGSYHFRAACVLLSPDAAGNQGPLVPCLVRDVGFVSNFQGSTVSNGCQVDFDPGQLLVPRNCSASGAMGTIPGALPPSATAAHAASATPTPLPSVPWQAPIVARAFFAEGYTGEGYHEYLSVLNPHRRPLDAQLTLYRTDGATRLVQVHVAGLARRTLDVNSLAPRAGTAMRVTADQSFVAERALYAPTGGGSIAAGAPLPERRWYVAEGYAGQGYAESLRIFNPYDSTASLTFTAYTERGAMRVSHRAAAGGTRINVPFSALTLNGSSSIVIDSNEPVVVESIVQIGGNLGPSAAMALTAPSQTWYFPDGSTLAGNQEFFSLFNPGGSPALVRVQPFSTGDVPHAIIVHIPAHARASLPLHDKLQHASLAALLQSDQPIVAQEVRYTEHGGVALVDGVTQPSRSWGLAEGYAGAGFSEWLALFNPATRHAQAMVRLFGRNGLDHILRVQVPAQRVFYVYVNDVPPNGPVASLIDADRPIVVGRTLIFDNNSGLSTTSATSMQ